ncbi:MAG: hypothetical protein EXR07_09915 [Acetobacteraceae bacterium]|nr:hypothetical protein [Acetobacteraceae bacterium]
MTSLWRYIQVKKNREILAFVFGGLAAVIAGGWAVIAFLAEPKKPLAPQTTISAPGGVAVGVNNNSPITSSPTTPPRTPAK